MPAGYPMVPPYTPPRSRSRVGLILAFIGVGLFVAVVIAVMMIARFGRKFADNVQNVKGPPPVAQPGETLLGETSADQVIQTGNETAFIKTFPLDNGAAFSLRNVNGSITITAWNEQKVEIRALQKGTDRSTRAFFSGGKKGISIRTAEGRGGPEVRYEVRLPRELGLVELTSVNGSIKMSDVTGQIVLETTNGSIDLASVSGVSRVKTVNGKIKALLAEASDGPMSLETSNGSVELTVKPDFNAILDANAVHGSVSIDDQLGITVDRQIVGQHARGQIGTGGPLMKISTVNGSVKVFKEKAKETTDGN